MKKLFAITALTITLLASACRAPVYIYDSITDESYPKEVYDEMYPETATITIIIE